VQEDELIEVFSKGELEGQVEAVRVVKDPTTHLGKGFGLLLSASVHVLLLRAISFASQAGDGSAVMGYYQRRCNLFL
jgi:hypothetical protein